MRGRKRGEWTERASPLLLDSAKMRRLGHPATIAARLGRGEHRGGGPAQHMSRPYVRLRHRVHGLVIALLSSMMAGVSADGLTVRYFGYGSNLAKSVLEGRRRLKPVSTQPGFVRNERLAFNMLGLSPREPSFASLVAAPNEECHGCVFTLEPADWLRLLASEGVPFGGPLGYRVREVAVDLYGGGRVTAWTLGAGALATRADVPPSERYLALIREGARERGLTSAWRRRLAEIQPAPSGSRPAEPVAQRYERRRGSTFV